MKPLALCTGWRNSRAVYRSCMRDRNVWHLDTFQALNKKCKIAGNVSISLIAWNVSRCHPMPNYRHQLFPRNASPGRELCIIPSSGTLPLERVGWRQSGNVWHLHTFQAVRNKLEKPAHNSLLRGPPPGKSLSAFESAWGVLVATVWSAFRRVSCHGLVRLGES